MNLVKLTDIHFLFFLQLVFYFTYSGRNRSYKRFLCFNRTMVIHLGTIEHDTSITFLQL